MKRTALLLLAISLIGATGCSAASHDFDSAVSGVEHRYSVRARRIPMMGLIGLCARAYTHGGVKEMRIAEFESLQQVDPVELFSLVQSRLGDGWQPIVKEHAQRKENDGASLSVIFARPAGRSMQLLVADYDHGELELVRMGIDGAALSRWIGDHEHSGRSSHDSSVSGE